MGDIATMMSYKGEDKKRHFFYYYDKVFPDYLYTIIYTEKPPNSHKYQTVLTRDRTDLNIKGWINFPRIDFYFGKEKKNWRV